MNYIHTDKAPKAVGPYSQGILTDNGLLFISGQLPIDPKSGMVPADIRGQTKQSLVNLFAIASEAGFTQNNIVKTTVFMKDLSQFSEMNSIYESMFQGHKPARATFEVSKLPKDVLIEIEAICSK